MYASRQRRRRAATRRARAADIDRADAELLRVVDRDFAAAAARAGSWLLCGPGCTACCHGPFPITRLDVRRLLGGLATLEREEPRRAAALCDRAARAVDVLRPGFPGDASGRLDRDERALDGFFERHRGLACPVLDPQSGRCQLYASRPVSCRTFGPPVRFGDESAPPCELCFVGARAATVEGCRFEPDREGLEQEILAAMGAVDGADWETLIPFALVRGNGASR